MDPEMEQVMKEYAVMDSVATEILSDKQQVMNLYAVNYCVYRTYVFFFSLDR